MKKKFDPREKFQKIKNLPQVPRNTPQKLQAPPTRRSAARPPQSRFLEFGVIFLVAVRPRWVGFGIIFEKKFGRFSKNYFFLSEGYNLISASNCGSQKIRGVRCIRKTNFNFLIFRKSAEFFFKKNAEPDPSRSDGDQKNYIEFQKSRLGRSCGRTARRRRLQILWGVSGYLRKVFDFLKFFSRVEFFFENAKMCLASLKNSEVGLLRIRAGFRVLS